MLIGKSVLFVDDEPGIRQLGARVLGAAQCDTYVAGNGKEAIAVLEKAPIDLVIIDIIMPDKEGVETIMEIKARWPELKIIAISGGGRVGPDDFLHLASMVGADATMRKPLNFKDMVGIVAKVLAPKADEMRQVS